MRIFFAALFSLALAITTTAWASPIGDLQQLLLDAGYEVGKPTGKWSEQTAEGLAAFARDNGVGISVPKGKPNAKLATTLLTAVQSWLDSDGKAYVSETMPSGYFFGMGNEWFRNIHNWGSKSIGLADGRVVQLQTTRWSELLPQDLTALRAAGVTVMRMQLHWEGVVFWDECDGVRDIPYGQADSCYLKAYESARKAGWSEQAIKLKDTASNPGVQLYMNAVQTLNDAGFHVIVAPTDFYWGGGDVHTAPQDPLLHRYLADDPGLRTFYAKWIAAITGELRRRNLTNVSLQSLNEPRYCPDGHPSAKGLGAWTKFEAEIFSSARRVAPHLHLISSTTCAASDEYMANGSSTYARALPQITPLHNFTNITYAVHIRTPRMSFIGGDAVALMPRAEIAYPFHKLSADVLIDAGNENDHFNIDVYNKLKPSRDYFNKVFADIAAFGREHGVSMMVSEWDISRPEYGISRGSRLALVRDFSEAAKQNNIPTVYNAIFEAGGLSSCPSNKYVADHRFDPGFLNIMSELNGSGDASSNAALLPLETFCGIDDRHLAEQ